MELDGRSNSFSARQAFRDGLCYSFKEKNTFLILYNIHASLLRTNFGCFWTVSSLIFLRPHSSAQLPIYPEQISSKNCGSDRSTELAPRDTNNPLLHARSLHDEAVSLIRLPTLFKPVQWVIGFDFCPWTCSLAENAIGSRSINTLAKMKFEFPNNILIARAACQKPQCPLLTLTNRGNLFGTRFCSLATCRHHILNGKGLKCLVSGSGYPDSAWSKGGTKSGFQVPHHLPLFPSPVCDKIRA